MILVVGANGQLGASLKKLTTIGSAVFFNSKELNVRDFSQIERVILELKPKSIVNCSAYTNVEKAESDAENAFAVNQLGPKNLALISKKLDIPLIHVSTDYVFDGHYYLPYKETDATNPINVYGKSKLAGEEEIFAHASRAAIIRTSWLYSVQNSNFIGKVIELLKTKPELSIVADQIGTPTFSDDLALCILEMLRKGSFEDVQLFQYSNEGVASWYDVAYFIAKTIGVKKAVNPVSSDKYPTVAKRPSFSVLNKEKIKNTFGIQIKHWTESLELCLLQKQY